MASKMDVGLWFATVPPILIPMSDRAKELVRLPDDVQGIICLEEPDKVLSIFPDDWLVGEISEETHPEPPSRVFIGELEEVHLH